MTSTSRTVNDEEETQDSIDLISISVIPENGRETMANDSKDLNKSCKQGPRSFGDSISQKESFTPQSFLGVAKWDYVGDLKESSYFQPANTYKMTPIEATREAQAESLQKIEDLSPGTNVVPSEKVAPVSKVSPHEDQVPGKKPVQAPSTSKPTAVSTRVQDENTPSTSKRSAQAQKETVPSTLNPTAVSTRAQDEKTLPPSRLSYVCKQTPDENTPLNSKRSVQAQKETVPSTLKPIAVSTRTQDEKTLPPSRLSYVCKQTPDENTPLNSKRSVQAQKETVPSTLNPTAVSTRAQDEKTLPPSRLSYVCKQTPDENTPSTSKTSPVRTATRDEKAAPVCKYVAVSPPAQNEKAAPVCKYVAVSPPAQNEKAAPVCKYVAVSSPAQNEKPSGAAKPKISLQPSLIPKPQVAENVNEQTALPTKKSIKTIVLKKYVDLTASDFSIGEDSINYIEDEMADSEGDELKYSSHEDDESPSEEFSINKKEQTYSNIDQTKIAFLSSKHTKLTSTRLGPVTGAGTDSSGDSSSEECVLYQAKDVTHLLLPEHAESVAADAFLRMCKVNFVVNERINVEYMSPSGRGPLLRCGPVLVAEFEPIVSFIESIGIRLTKNLTDMDLGELQAYTSLIRNTLMPAELFVSWMHPGTRLEVTELYYSQYHPYPLNIVVNRRKQQAAWELLQTLDRPFSSLHDAYSAVERCLRALNDRLGAASYFFGNVPTQLDALVYGHLLLLGTLPVPKGDCFLRNMLGNYPALVALVERIDALTDRRSDLSFMKEGICEVKTRALIESYIEARQISSLAAVGNRTYDYLGGINKYK